MFKNSKRWIGLLIAVVVLASTAIGAFVYVQHRADLYDIQQEALAQLEKDAGQYDEQSIVLQNTSKAKAEKLAELYGADLRITEDGKFATLTLPEGTTIRDAYAREESLPHIEEMAADYQVRVSDLIETADATKGENNNKDEEKNQNKNPSRPQYSVSDKDYKLQTYLDYLNMQNVWGSYTGSGVTVAVIDTGIDTDHPEFAGRISEYSYNATEDKIVKDYLLEDGSYDWSLIEDEWGHGTAVTGVIAASMNQGNVVGIAPKVNIIVIKAECDENRVFKRTSDLVFGLYYAIERDVQVVNMSFGGPGAQEKTNPFAEATRLAYDSDIICVASAGNESTAGLHYPSADPLVIGVGALDADSWELADYSNYGENVDLVAPGTTYTTLMGGEYGLKYGTSLAAPITTGAIALYMQSDKYATFDEVTEVLYASCADLGDLGRDWYYGFGALDVYAFTKEARGTITYDMLTDELENQEGLFISGHTLQELPEPERLYAVFDGWYYDDTFTQEYVYYEDKFYDDVTLYAKWANEDDGIPYTYVILDDGTVEIRSYTGRRRYITIPEKIDGRIVSSIGEEAFKGQTRLREVTLPSGLVQIRREAFAGCANLMTITIPSNVVTIGERAFAENVRLHTVAFAGNSQLESIGDFAFSACSSLEEIELPSRLNEINGSAFYGATALRSITVQKGNKNFTSYEGVLYNFTGGTLVAFPASRSDSYTLLNNTHTVGSYAFAYAKVKTVDLAKVKQFEDYAFIYSQLEEVEIPHNIKTLGVGVFSHNYSLMRVNLGDKLTEVTKETFYYCTSLHEILIPQNIVSIGEFAFAGSGLMTVSFEEYGDLVSIGKVAFWDCPIEEIAIPSSVATIAEGAFKNTALSVVRFADDSELRTIESFAFMDCFFLDSVELPSRLETIGSLAFANTRLATVTVPASVTTLEDGAFACNASLSEILVETPNNTYHSLDGVVYTKNNTKLVQYPGGKASATYTVNDGTRIVAAYAFAGTMHLSDVILPEGMEILSEYSFCDASIRSVSLPATLTEIQQYTFYRCVNLKKLTIPDNVMQIGCFAVAECWSLTQITFTENTKLPRISYGAFAYSGLTSFTVPANVSTMAQGAFEGCKNLTSFTFAANSKLEGISAYMFDGCTNLKTITFKSGSALTSIQAHGLEGMDKLTSIDFGDAKLTNIDNFAFRFCESLSTLNIPDSLTNIGRYAFYGCKSLAELSVPESLEHIGSYAFLGTKDLNLYFAGETLPLYLDENWDHGIKGYYTGVQSVATSGDYKYAVLTSGNIAILEYLGNDTAVDLTAVNLGAPITIIGGSAFEDSAVTSIVLPESLTSIQAEAFRYTALEEVSIPAGVTFIGREAFAHTKLNKLTFADGSQLSVIEQYAFEKTKNLREVALPASLQTMGTGVFAESGLESVTFEEGILLAEIPQKAFASTKLTAVDLPDSVTLVNHNAFNNVTTLQSVTFGDNDGIRLMSNAFYHTGLTSLHIPANVTYIGEYCFVALSDLTEYTVDADNPNYTAVDGLLMNKTGRKLIAVPAGRTGSLTVPLSVEEIGFGAFEESQLSEVKFDKNANILTLGYRAFFKAENITKIHIPASVVSIDYYAFAYCKNLKTVAFAEDNQLKGIYEGAFLGCVNLKDIEIPETIVEIFDFAFYGCSALTEIPVDDTNNIKGIYSYAFAYTGISGEFTTPENLYDIGIGDYAFMGTKVTKVTVPDTMQKQLIIGIGVFEECNQLEEITLPFIGASFENEQISWLGYIFGAGTYAANDTYVPKSLKTVTITEGITAVYTGGFYQCTSLETINVPHSVSVLWDYAFGETTARYELTNTIMCYSRDRYGNILPAAASATFGKGISGELILADGVTDLNDAFYKCANLKGITIPKSVTYIGDYAFRECTNLFSVIVPETMTSIGHAAFYDCINLNYIVIPESVTSIGDFAFRSCAALTSITIPNGVNSISDNTFAGCTNLTNIYLPENVTSIGAGAFSACTNLTNIYLPENVTYIGRSAFSGCSALVDITIPEGVMSIEDQTFYNCTSLVSIVIPEGVNTIGEFAFHYCAALEEISIPSTLTTVFAHAFIGCERLRVLYNNSNLPVSSISENIKILIDKNGNKKIYGTRSYIYTPEGFCFYKTEKYNYAGHYYEEKYTLVAYLGNEETITLPSAINGKEYTLESFYGGVNVIIPYGVTQIKGYFDRLGTMESLTIPESVVHIDSGAIPDNVSLILEGENQSFQQVNGVLYDKPATKIIRVLRSVEGHVDILDGVTHIPASAFKNCTGLTGVTIPNSVKSIDSYAFYNCTSLTSITIPKSVTIIENNAFAYCSDLSEVVISEGVTQIGADAFSFCYNLKSVTIPATVISIESHAFSSCRSLTSVTISDGVKIIGSCAFQNCESLAGIVFPKSVNDVGVNAFQGCSSLITATFSDDTAQMRAGVFSKCSSLENVSPIRNVTERMFEDCTALKKIAILDGAEIIAEKAFSGCVSLQSIDIPESVTAIETQAFNGCDALVDFFVHSNVNYIGDSVFSTNTRVNVAKENDNFQLIDGILYDTPASRIIFVNPNLVDVVIPEGVTSIKDKAFQNCTKLVSISIPDSVTAIGEYAFDGCSSLRTIKIPDNITEIKLRTFRNCSALTSVTIGKNVNSIYNEAFWGCRDIVSVNNRSSLNITFGHDHGGIASTAYVIIDKTGNKAISRIGFEGYEFVETEDQFLFTKKDGEYCLRAYLGSDETITLPHFINGQEYVINGFRGGINIIIPNGIAKIDELAFVDCGCLNSITIPESVTTIAYWAFKGCYNLSEIHIPDGVTRIEEYAFEGCTKLTNCNIPESVMEIETGVFDNTAIYNDPANWYNGQLFVDGWLIDVLEATTHLTDPKKIDKIIPDAFNGCYRLKGVPWNAGLKLPSNVETLYITKINSGMTSVPSALTLKNVIICDTVGASDLQHCQNLLKNLSGVTIYVEALEDDLRWDDNFPGWSNGNRVVYGDDWTWANFYDENGTMIQSEPRLNSQVIRLPVYEIEPDEQFTYELVGWDVNGDGEADSIPATSVVDIEAHAVVKARPRLYTVRFEDRDTGMLYHSAQLSYGSVISLPAAPEKKGYTFAGWSGYNDGMTVTGDVVIYASWRHNTASHVYAEPVWVEATCTEPGHYRHICMICGEFYSTGATVALGHTYEMTVIALSCNENGYTLYSCIRCEDSYTDAIVPATGHSYGDWVVDHPAGCATEGAQHRDCIACGHQEDEIIPITGHTFEIVDQTESTCTQSGELTYRCATCESTFAESSPLEPHTYQKQYASMSFLDWSIRLLMDILWGYEGDQIYCYACGDCGHIRTSAEANSAQVGTASTSCRHNSSSWKTEANCVVGLEVYVCDLCEERLALRLFGDPTDHSFGEWFVTNDPTCIEQGEQRRDCNVCDHYETAEIAVLGHDLTQHEGKEPACTEIGWYAYETCSRCDHTTYVEIPATGHKYGEWIVTDQPTCLEKGEQRRDCDVCDHYETAEVVALGHDLTQHKAQAPTCTEIGWHAYETCSRCDHTTYVEIPATGHKYGEWIVTDQPTCLEKGDQRRDCVNCDHYETAEVVALGHDLTQHKAQAPTCTEIGWHAYETCSRCDHTTYVEIPATGHDHKATVTAPTCTEQGYTTHTCHCGDSYVDSYVDELGHDLTQHKAQAPTCTEIGWETYETCSRCDHTTYVEIPATGHDHKAVVTAPTCTEQGYTTHTCHCGDTYVDSYVDATGHKYGEWYEYQAPTTTAVGEERRTCQNCDHFESREIPKLTLSGWVQENGKWCYFENGKKVTNKWLLDSVGWCYVGEDGYCVTNSWKADSKGWCYLDENGRMATNRWVRDSVGWCYVGADGYAVTNCWKKDSVGWCYLNSNGSMTKSAWVNDGGKWYYLDETGYMVTNKWKADSKGWVYLGSDGAMKTNAWVRDSVGWCYVGADGYAVTNCWKKDSVGWCYLNSNGSMTKNAWVQDGGKWYYLDGNGYTVTSKTITVSGKKYTFNAKGEWIA